MTGNSRRWLPAAVAVLAIVAMAVAARRDTGLDAGLAAGPAQNLRPLVALIAVIALIVVAATFAKHRDDGYGVLRRAGTATGLLLTAAAILTPVGLLVFGRKLSQAEGQQPDNGPETIASTSQSQPPGQRIKPPVVQKGLSLYDKIAMGVLYLVVAAALAMLLYAVINWLRNRRFSRQALPMVEFSPLDPEVEQLTEAVAAGAAALEYEGDAREAVIACYAAMEQAVSAGGSERRATDTPEEFLSRVTAAHLIPEGPARDLTELFREARFSRHPITEQQRNAAREALSVISEALRARVEAAVARMATAGASTTGDRSV